MKKTYCILEQGCSINDPESVRKRKIFSTEFSDFYRLNWKFENDPNADYYAPNTVWSEGRSILYENLEKKYDYYIFIDDDAVFSTKAPGGIAQEIKRLLERYRPLAGTFLLNPTQKAWFFDSEIENLTSRIKEAFLIAGFDLCVHFFHRSFANVMFPVIFHGSGKSMWYAQWACSILYPTKQMCFTTVTYENTRADPHEDANKPQFVRPNQLVNRFNESVTCESMVWQQPGRVRTMNSELLRGYEHSLESRPSLDDVIFTLEDLHAVYDITNSSFLSRTATARCANISKVYRVYFVHHRLKCVYMLIPKGGSRTILLRLGIGVPDILARTECEGIPFNPKIRVVKSGALPMKGVCEITGELIWERKSCLAPHELDYFFFTFVRNPAERVASAYRDFFLKRCEPQRLFKGFTSNTTFDSLVEYVCKTPDKHLNPHLKSQISILKPDKPPVLDFVGKLESFEGDWIDFCERIGREDLATNISLNITKSISESSSMSRKNLEDLETRFSNDYQILGYKKR